VSRFDYNYLNENVRVGFASERGPAWWSQFMGADSSHFDGAVPLSEAQKLFDWVPLKRALMVEGEIGEAIPLKDYKGSAPVAITHSRTGVLLGIMADNYPDTGYQDRLLKGLTSLLDTPDTELAIGSVGMLDGGSQAWVQLETPETLTHSSGEKFRPWLTAYSSLDGTLKTTFKEGTTRVVCDNTFEMSHTDSGKKYAYKNTANSKLVVATARDALDLLDGVAENYMAELDDLTNTEVNARQFEAIIEDLYPMRDEVGKPKTGRGKTIAENIHIRISDIYRNDDRVGQFVGTKWGAFQAFSTYNQHETSVRKDDNEFQRNTRKLLSGKTGDYDAHVMSTISKVLAAV